MKKSELRNIIKEELQAVLREKEEEVELSSDEQKIFDFIIGERVNEIDIDVDAVKRRVKSAAKKGILTTVILVKLFQPTFGFSDAEKVEIMQAVPDMEMLADVDDVGDITDVLSVEDVIKEITDNPQQIYNKLTSDTSYQESIAKAFQGDNMKQLQDMRVKYFVDQGKATMSSPEIDELSGGKQIKDMAEYDELVDKYKGKSKVMSYDKSSPADKAVNKIFNLIQKLVQEYKPAETEKENTADFEELMRMRKAMGLD
jgi:hypothetical protein